MAGPSILLLCASLLSLLRPASAAGSDWKVPFGNNEHVQLVPLSSVRRTSLAPGVVFPDDDPFYKTPPGIAEAKAGAVLRTRRVPNGITFDNKRAINIKDAWQILYRTQDSLGNPESNVVTVLVPWKPKKDHHFNMAYFTDSASNKCNPSIMLQLGAPQDSTTPMVQTSLAVVALSQGWIVSIPDSTGPKAAYACGGTMAYTTMDGMRAVLATGNLTGMGPDPITTMYGYSGGASIASWVSELQPTYAPELKIHGVALGGLVPSLLRALKAGNKGERSKFIAPALLGVSKDYPKAAKWLKDNLIPERAAEFREALNYCFDTNEKKFSFKDMGMYLKNGYDSIFTDPVMSAEIERAGTMGKNTTPKVPWYLYDTLWDDTPIAEIDAFVANHCRNGASILFERNDKVKLNHSMEAMYGVTGAYQWLLERHNGLPVAKGCKTVSLSQQSRDGVSKGTLTKGLTSVLKAGFGGVVTGP